MISFKKKPRRSTHVALPDDSKKGRRAARKAGERRQRDDDRALIGKIDQSDPYWADRD